jgi:flagellar protein FlgJ
MAKRPRHVAKFIDDVAAQAQAVAWAAGLPASVMVAQAGVETQWGTKVVGNAYFGVKANYAYYQCKAKVKFQTREAQPHLSGVHAFCAYKGFFEAAQGYVEFIQNSPQFEPALAVKDKPLQYAAAVADGGYAGGTDRAGREAYKKLLHTVIHQFNLLELDRVMYMEPMLIKAG